MIIMITFIFVQVYYINKYNKEKNVVVYNAQNRIVNHKTLKEFNEELSCLKEKNIIAANQINKEWYIKVKLQGTKEELLNEISKLKNYNISDYIISRSKEKNSINSRNKFQRNCLRHKKI